MTTDLAQHIQATPLADTHDHQLREETYLRTGHDVLQEIFANYTTQDLITAGATPEAIARMNEAADPDIAARFRAFQQAWEACQLTGYGENSRIVAKMAFGLDEITPDSLAEAQRRFGGRDRRGERLRLLREVANMDHVQVDDFLWGCPPDETAPDFFLYDLSWWTFSRAEINPEAIDKATGVTVRDLSTLRQAMERIFELHAPTAVAVKAQQAYDRTLAWTERTDADAERALAKVLAGGEVSEADKLCLGDWALARGVELATEYDLPFKMHTGYLAGNDAMLLDRVRVGQLCPLLIKYPQARFDLFHMAYGYQDELIAIAKHFSNVSVDMCWTWALDPYASVQFLRRMIRAVPVNKLFLFGGDSMTPWPSVAHAVQCRQWATRALEAEVTEGTLTEAQAIDVATRVMRANQAQYFRVDEKRATNRAALAAGQA